MSGHSKWNNIKKTKEKTDAQRGKIFTKIGREIAVAVKMGGMDPSTNSKLADVIQKAKQNNMPSDTIMRSIKKAGGEGSQENYEEIIYEGYGPGGSAIIVQCLTDNKNRTAGDVRHLFDKHGAGLGTANSVAYMFDIKGVFVIEKDKSVSEDDVYEKALEVGADDVEFQDDVNILYSSKENFHTVKKCIEETDGIKLISASIEYVPNNKMELPEEYNERFEKLIDGLEELDDVQNVYHNCD